MVQRLAQLLCLHPSQNRAAYQQMILLLCFKRNGVSSLFPSNPGQCSPRLQKPTVLPMLTLQFWHQLC